MENILNQLCNVLRVLMAVLVGALTIPVAMQVISRYVGILPSYLWTEELSTFIFIWIVMIGSMVAVWEGTHFDVRVTPDAKTPFGKLIQDGIVLVLMLIFALLFAWYGIAYAKFGGNQHSVMMQANLMITHIAVPIAGMVWTVFAGFRLFQVYQTYKATLGQRS